MGSLTPLALASQSSVGEVVLGDLYVEPTGHLGLGHLVDLFVPPPSLRRYRLQLCLSLHLAQLAEADRDDRARSGASVGPGV